MAGAGGKEGTHDDEVELGVVELARDALDLEADGLHLLGREPEAGGLRVVAVDGDLGDVDADDGLDVVLECLRDES